MGLAALVAFSAWACTESDETTASATSSNSASNGSTSSVGGSSASSGGSTGAGGDIPSGGTIFFEEHFDDADLAARGWYDGPGATISTAEHIDGSSSSFECSFAVGATSCSGGVPARHALPDSETVYLSFHLKFSANWVGSGQPYHPHMFHFISNLDDAFVGPAYTHLTTYTEVVEGRAFLALQDSANVDQNCILLNNDNFVGCNGDFNSYMFTENRSACSCNGLMGFVEQRDCYDTGSYWYSARAWRSPMEAFGDGPAPFDKNSWHFVEAYFEMNSIQNGVGVPDGKIRWVQDGQTLISSDQILLRTGANATMAFNQFASLFYIGDGSPIAQQFWVDDLVVASARP